MSSRLAFQTQLASIMEVLANAAVAEICKLVDDDYAVVSLQMSQCQRENKALKRKLHLLELKMARGAAERRLRDSAANSSRPRVQIRGESSSSSTGGAFERQMDVSLWSSCGAAVAAAVQPVHADDMQCKSPDVQLVEPEQQLLVKEESVEANKVEEMEEEVSLIGHDGVLERVHRGASGQRTGLEQDAHSQTQTSRTRPPARSSRGVEVSDSSPLLNCPPTSSNEARDSLEETITPPQLIDDSRFDVLCDDDKSANSLVEDFFDESAGAEGEGHKPPPSWSYTLAAADFPSTSSGVNGWAHYGAAFPPPAPLGGDAAAAAPLHRTSAKEKLFACSYCGKAFNRPKKVEIHQRIHTGERPFSCSTCGKKFSEAGNLRKHQRIHTGEKSYCCGLCGKGFAWIRNLKAHQQRSHPGFHTEEAPTTDMT